MQYSPIDPPPSLVSASWSIFAPCEESDSRTVLTSKARGIERAATAVRSSFGISVHPNIPFFVLAPPPSQDVPELAATAVRSPHGMSVQPHIPIYFSMPPPSWDGGFLASSAC